ncbi:flavin-dependent dehydrogenase [Belliella baltica DSM 15883]|uniref:Flavin-dependent dehydrogenase n=1 Tax=Belliella baltica (strain DSM 15883 / CIP 108006 / LMG 21964 / BA134) TaxID=866536 RepID=I3Z3P1_BELBD|nr:flavin-dependent dehydrogenase [Belliella baltica DSM 15883]
MSSFEIIIIGGGLAGLTAANLLAKQYKKVLLIEKKTYPFQRVCGEYISNEVTAFLKKENLYPNTIEMSDINTFQLSSVNGKSVTMPLDLGGFGVSRYVLDDFLFKKAKSNGAEFMLQTQVEDLVFDKKEDLFKIKLDYGAELSAVHIIGAFGKRSKMDKSLDRDFIKQRSPYIGVKYHIKTDFDPNTVALHNFEGGYCGFNKIEGDKYNLCYLGSRDQLRDSGSIEQMERTYLWKNPILEKIWKESDFLFEKPEVINEVNFSPKKPVENHVLMAGDAAGLITPLCGNGMAIAIHSGMLAAESILKFSKREDIEKNYELAWNTNFQNRLWIGRNVQRLFGAKGISEFAVALIKNSNFIAHHFTDEELLRLFGSFLKKAKLGIIINDLHRHQLAYFSIKALTRLFSKSPMVQNDGPLSVLRGFSKKDLTSILNRSGIENAQIKWFWAFRWQVIVMIS